MTSDLETSYRYCRQVVRRASSNLASTFWLLRGEQRRGMDALYAFARQADDLVDRDEPLAARRASLAHFRQAIIARMTSSSPPSFSDDIRGPLALLPALEDTVQRFHIPPSHLLELLAGVEMDLDRSSYQTFDELRVYCCRVASSVGLACLSIWDSHHAAARQPAIDCGIAFQLTNILRDIREDARRGRVYLPAEELGRFGLSSRGLLDGEIEPEWDDFLQFQIARAESFFESGSLTSSYLPAAGERVFRLMLARYRSILREIKRRGVSVLHARAQLSYPRKLLVAAGALISSARIVGGTLRVPSAPHTEGAGYHQSAECAGYYPSSVAIIGGGLAGLAAAAALCERGFKVELFESRRRLGGRAGSYLDKESGELIDHCQHVALGCCTNFLDFCRRTGVLALFERYETLHFFGPDGKRCDFRPSSWLPAPLHLAPAFRGLRYLSGREQRSIAWTLLRLARLPAKERPGDPTIGDWLRQQQQSPRCIERFWQVVLVSALGESLNRASLTAARKVFVDGFLAARGANHLLVPNVPLGELYDKHLAGWLRKRGVQIHLEAPLKQVQGDEHSISQLCFGEGSARRFDFTILALPWNRVADVLPPTLRAVLPESVFAAGLLGSAPITSVHLWFDLPIMELPHAVLVGRLSQWVFGKGDRREQTCHYQVVISASHELAGRDREEVLREVLGDLKAVFPQVQRARLLRWKMITEQEAVFSVRPGVDQIRPAQKTGISNLFLAGDWTATGWPSTMEGAVRSGYLGAEAVLRAAGRENKILVPDLHRGIVSRWLF